ncbi:helicase SRCAP [Trichonephila clavipes]|nr:helicase SRCAP [Trichonephila clavipes]
MLNWEMEFKKWCPAFKVLTYYGGSKEREQKRVDWTEFNAFHVCITSYKLVAQDYQFFTTKKWNYLILDEAQHIKNFRSERWQTLSNFESSHRLLLTGIPLQNNLMELWSLMHFLMPNVVQSDRDLKEWFSNPFSGILDDSHEYNENRIQKLHKVLDESRSFFRVHTGYFSEYSGPVVVYRASTPQVQVLLTGWARSTLPFIPAAEER